MKTRYSSLLLAVAAGSGALAPTAFSQDIGVEYCPGNTNSTGSAASLTAAGSLDAADNDLTLTCAGLPPRQFGLFLFSLAPGFAANPAGSAGNLCLGGTIGRDNAGVLSSGPTGEATRTLDLGALPYPNQPLQAQAGDALHFQFWHRDVVAGAATSNFSPGVRVQLLCEAVDFGSPAFVRRNLSSAAFGDFDGDGRVDVVTTGTTPFLRVHLGDGAGGFRGAGDHDAPGVAGAVSVQDVDLDGDADLLVVRRQQSGELGAAVLFLGDGQGGFTQTTTLVVGPDPEAVVSADFSGDGIPDHVLARPGAALLSLVTSDASGAPTSQLELSVAGGRRLLAAEDFNGDGRADLAVSGGPAPTQVFLNLGGGSLFPGSAFGMGSIRGLCAQDVDLDGDVDLIEAQGPGNPVNRTWLNDGTANFSPGPTFGGGGALLCGDIDGDLVPDVIQAGVPSDRINAYGGDGMGGYLAGGSLEEATFLGLEGLEDVDGDGFQDVLASGTDGWAVHFGRGPAGFAPTPDVFTEFFVSGAVTRGDFDGDGFVDIAWGASSRVKIGYGDGTRAWPPARIDSIVTFGLVDVLKSGDLDGDGDLDLVVGTGFPGNVYPLENTPLGFQPAPAILLTDDPRDIDLFDYTGDGALDILVAEGPAFGPGTALVYENTGALDFSLLREWPLFFRIFTIAGGDVDGDGLADVAIGSFNTKLVFGNAPTNVIDVNPLPAPTDIALIDLDGNGQDEIFSVTAFGLNALVVSALDSTGGFVVEEMRPSPSGSSRLETYDVEGDGVPDFVASGGTTAAVAVFRGTSHGVAAPPDVFKIGARATSAIPVDFDGDGITDLVTIRESLNQVAITWGTCR